MAGGCRARIAACRPVFPAHLRGIVAAIWATECSMVRFESGERRGLSRSQVSAWASATASADIGVGALRSSIDSSRSSRLSSTAWTSRCLLARHVRCAPAPDRGQPSPRRRYRDAPREWSTAPRAVAWGPNPRRRRHRRSPDPAAYVTGIREGAAVRSGALRRRRSRQHVRCERLCERGDGRQSAGPSHAGSRSRRSAYAGTCSTRRSQSPAR
jgi:hypothetical protein